jgi:hypothetical protein
MNQLYPSCLRALSSGPPRLRGAFLALLFALVLPVAAQTGFPFQDESLHYSVNWPSGLSLGDASFTAQHTTTGWNLSATLDAIFPGFPLKDKYQSSVTSNLCSLELNRDITHGPKKSKEKTVFDPQRGKAQRGAGPEFDIPSCAKDALAFLYYTRREMGQGRVPPAQQIWLGSAYAITSTYTGTRNVTLGSEKPAVTDQLNVAVKGPASSFAFEICFARDAARTPLLIRVPISLGTFSMELVR